MKKIDKSKPVSKAKKPKKPMNTKRMLVMLWTVFFIGLGCIVFLFVGTAFFNLLGPMPDVKELENPDIYLSSEIVSSDGLLLDRFETEKRLPMEFDEIPPAMIDALVSREDIRFTEHAGIDGRGTLRAITSLGSSGGGSTITQQLAKLLFTKQGASGKIERATQKIKEWIVAAQLEKRYSKNEIITMYFNKFDFLYGANGVRTAAKVYFNKDMNELSTEECAMLVAMLRNPIVYNPRRNPENAKKERNVVLKQMEKYNKITSADYNTLKNKPLVIDYQPVNEFEDEYGVYFKQALKQDLKKWAEQYKEETGKEIDIYKDGLKIYVTIDSRMQKLAEDAVKKHLTYMQKLFFGEHRGRKNAPFYGISDEKRERIFQAAMKRTIMYKNMKDKGMKEEEILAEFNKPRDSVSLFDWNNPNRYEKNMSWMDSIRYHKHILQAGVMSMDPRDGTIKAWVGGIDWNHFKYDHVRQARRQVGSTFKPIVYATAISQNNMTPCDQVSNARFTSGTWRPGNANGKYGGSQDLRTALAYSTNVISARLISKTGTQPVRQMAQDLGIETPIKERDMTIALGSADLKLYEMVGALSTFANYGNYIKPQLILRIEDKTGKVLKDYEPEVRPAVSEDVAYTMIELMRGVYKMGTGKWLSTKYGISADIACKTGTTNDNSDGWFMGLTPNLVTGVWVGAEDRFAHFWSTGLGQGASMALPIWAYYMRGVYDQKAEFGVSKEDKFEEPKGILERWNCDKETGTYAGMGGVIVDYVDETVEGSTKPNKDNANAKLKNDSIGKEGAQNLFGN